jgi:glycosyltransferase involved in cell wall biosynthesis
MINVIIPAFNAHETIEKAIYSIAIQTISNLIEIILIDDCSDKDYIDIIKKFENIIKIRYIRNKKNLGIGITRQIAIDNVNQKYFAFLDSDDIYIDAMAFEKMLFCLENNKKNVACFSLFKEEIKGFQKYLQRELTIQ